MSIEASGYRASDPKVQITEIYLSVQGESTFSGLPCTFIRLTGCPLRCSYCDTEYAFFGGKRMAVSEVVMVTEKLGCRLVEVTGGEPLTQPNCRILLQELVDRGFTVLLETSGAYPIADLSPQVHKIMDLKCPSSGESHRNLWENLDFISRRDEIKFVMGSREDYEWARTAVRAHNLETRCGAVLFSCVFGKLDPKLVVEWMLEDKLYASRFQLQAHKFIWEPEAKGV